MGVVLIIRSNHGRSTKNLHQNTRTGRGAAFRTNYLYPSKRTRRPIKEDEKMDDAFVSELEDVFLSTLEDLRLSVEEPKLSEDELKINNQLQEDELLALESIYGDKVVILNREADLLSFQIRIDVEAPEELTICTQMQSAYENNNFRGKATSSTTSVACSNESLSTFEVQYLPPIVLTCLLPKSYPSHLPPLLTIYIKWLDSMNISRLCSMLDSIWMDQPRQEILYEWIEWLHNSPLSYLGIGRELNISPYDMLPDAGERRAFSGIFSLRVDIPLIMNYNDVKCGQVFRASLHECFICFEEYAGIDFMRLPCKHCFCLKCMKTLARMHVKEGTIDLLRCPGAKCREVIPPGLLKCLLKEEEFERWESLLLQKTLDSMSDVVYCTRCETICLEDGDNHAQCTNCFFSFCILCKEQRHVGRPCATSEQKLARLEAQQSSSKFDDELLRKLQDAKNEMLSLRVVLKESVQCPSCKIAISRISGCNKVKCTNCGKFFCYRCLKQIDSYDHFRVTNCNIYPEDDPKAVVGDGPRERRRQERDIATLEALDARNHVQRVIAQRIAELEVADPAHSCPICHQFNAKVNNNNHIHCWSCQNHYCYACQSVVKRSLEHYGPKGCKQHSVG